jgi:hypothetical protein
MIRLTFAAAIAALVFAVLPAAQAAPIAPLPTAVASDAANGHVTQVWWRSRHWCRWHPHRC